MNSGHQGAAVKVIRKRLTANGTTTVSVGFGIQKMALTVKGVVAATNVAATPTAWNVAVKGRPTSIKSTRATQPTAVTIDDHVSGVEADGACVQSAVTTVLTDIDIVLGSLNLGATATALDVEIVLLGF